MKKYIFLLFVFTSFIAQSQFGNQGMRGQRQRQMPQTQQKPPEPNYEVEKYLGIVVYDIEKAAKKSKIKLSSDVGKAFSKTLTVYNKKIKDLRRINSFTLKTTKEMVENFQRNARKTGDLSDQKRVNETMTKNLKPISESLKIEDLKLDKKLKGLLSEKQYKKWIKYNRKLYKVFPKEEVEK
ncbi:hypothetical protein [Polaribacter porphyrae]|uniref:DUF4142 domain-containing protein n=1 Tax=Polaribacter porphyrae TaxID=1137780 RepID=A0A2S7WR86_9FLAO|nr:hypothetical protein [Polaribacter porphyrae]PQJ79966.1 hypothetical protein BTO18_12635 [Polaribacter porphyrae]